MITTLSYEHKNDGRETIIEIMILVIPRYVMRLNGEISNLFTILYAKEKTDLQ